MQHFVITYNIDNATNRAEFVADFEDVLIGLNMHKEVTNQSTYFGAYTSKEDLIEDLFDAVNKMDWKSGDTVTIYYPKVQNARPKNLPDIKRYAFKDEGSVLLNHIIL